MQQLRESVNAQFRDSEPWTLISRTSGGIVLTYALLKLILNFKAFKTYVIRLLFKAALAIPGAQRIVEEKNQKMMKDLEAKLYAHLDLPKFTALPPNGLSHEDALKLLTTMRDREAPSWDSDKISGGIYITKEHVDLINRAYCMYTVSNPLHIDLFPSVRKMEAEVIRMTASIFTGDDEVAGAMTSGGSESILMALKVYRDYYRQLRPHITEPEIVAPTTAHSAFNKGCQYFGLKLVSVPVNERTFVADVAAMQRAITPNTVALVASATNFPHGILDPVADLSAIAVERGIGLHVDCCLGGFVVPFMKKNGAPIPDFDFRLPGVTSISADTHKFGQAPKGSSVILFRNKQLRRHMFFATTEWPGGLYASPGMAGSRPGAVIAATWASLIVLGESGLRKQAQQIAEVHAQITKGIREIEGLEVLGDPTGPVVAWRSADSAIDIFRIGDALGKRGWNLNSMHKPNCLHICVTARHAGRAAELLNDLRQAVVEVKSTPNAHGGMAPMYGMAASLPDRSIISGFLYDFLDLVLKAPK